MSSPLPPLRERYHTHAIPQQERLLPRPKLSASELAAVAANRVAAMAPNRAARESLAWEKTLPPRARWGRHYRRPCLVHFPSLEPECTCLELEHHPIIQRSCLPELVQPEVAPSAAREGGRRTASAANGVEWSRWDDSTRPCCWDKLAPHFYGIFQEYTLGEMS